MWLKSVWRYLRNPETIRGVVSNAIWYVILVAITGIVLLIISLIKSINFLTLLKQVLYYRIPVYSLLIIGANLFLAIVLFRLINKYFPTNKKILNAVPSTNSKIGISQKVAFLPIDHRFPFNSNNAQFSAFDAYGEQLWDNTSKKLVGFSGVGEFGFENNVLIIDRKNTEGRFIVKIKGYYYNELERNFIPKNINGKNPRYFKLSFEARSLKGQQKLIFTFQKLGTHIWLSHPEYAIGNKDWQNQSASIAVYCHEDIFMELQIFETTQEPGLLQIKNILVEETQK